jgi:hypothetical protein
MMKTLKTTGCLILLGFGLATGGTLKNEVNCTGARKQGEDASTGYNFDIPCTEVKKMAGEFEDLGSFDPGSEICGRYITPEDAPFNIDGPCGSSNAVPAPSTE